MALIAFLIPIHDHFSIIAACTGKSNRICIHCVVDSAQFYKDIFTVADDINHDFMYVCGDTL